eukprot:c9377_g1_i1.p1 GENE.c9377_g1_i1~~c9377_g1_i1.p1  ORF type:complete len:496 (+),score=114.91 c9377_g1_i1:35-1522(+)
MLKSSLTHCFNFLFQQEKYYNLKKVSPIKATYYSEPKIDLFFFLEIFFYLLIFPLSIPFILLFRGKILFFNLIQIHKPYPIIFIHGFCFICMLSANIIVTYIPMNESAAFNIIYGNFLYILYIITHTIRYGYLSKDEKDILLCNNSVPVHFIPSLLHIIKANEQMVLSFVKKSEKMLGIDGDRQTMTVYSDTKEMIQNSDITSVLTIYSHYDTALSEVAPNGGESQVTVTQITCASLNLAISIFVFNTKKVAILSLLVLLPVYVSPPIILYEEFQLPLGDGLLSIFALVCLTLGYLIIQSNIFFNFYICSEIFKLRTQTFNCVRQILKMNNQYPGFKLNKDNLKSFISVSKIIRRMFNNFGILVDVITTLQAILIFTQLVFAASLSFSKKSDNLSHNLVISYGLTLIGFYLFVRYVLSGAEANMFHISTRHHFFEYGLSHDEPSINNAVLILDHMETTNPVRVTGVVCSKLLVKSSIGLISTFFVLFVRLLYGFS